MRQDVPRGSGDQENSSVHGKGAGSLVRVLLFLNLGVFVLP